MQHFPSLKHTVEADPDPAPDVAAPKLMDRSQPRLTSIIGGLFSLGSFLCLIAVSVLALFYVTIVALGGEVVMIPIFTALGASLVAGMLLLDFTHAKSLAGYRAAREKTALRSRAMASVFICILMGMIHPLMACAIPLSAGLGCLGHYLLKRLGRSETAWDFLPKESISILSGRDRIGFRMAQNQPRSHVMSAPTTRAGNAVSVLFSLAFGSYLVAENIMAMAAFVPLVMASLWASQEILNQAEAHFAQPDNGVIPAAKVARIDIESEEDRLGLNVHGLSLRTPDGASLMSDVDLEIEPGQIVGILGASGAGKSLLLRAISDPFSLSNVSVTGTVQFGHTDLWLRRGATQDVPVVLLPSEPLLLPASGTDNLTCFHDDDTLKIGRWFLERLVFSIEMVDSICDASDAQTLPSMQRKVLAMARAFLLRPSLYLLDRPEDGLPEKQANAVVHRLKQEAKSGRSVMMVTNNRTFLNACDRIFVLQQGRIIDYGNAKDVRDRMEVGWSRFIGDRSLETNDTIVHWASSHFLRDGDEGNKRKVAVIAADMLAFSCQSADMRNPGKVQFLFKHFEGHCILRMIDDDPPVSAGAIHKAQTEAASDLNLGKMSLLGGIMRNSEQVECTAQQDGREVKAQIKTYDPRKPGFRRDA